MEVVAALASALWLGILTSISPCPLASNLAAVSYVGRHFGRPGRVLLAGIAYALGRAVTYVLVAALVVNSVLSISAVSFFLQERMNQILGPLLVLIGAGILARLSLPIGGFDATGGMGARLIRRGVIGAGMLGVVFALSFCPVSAGLFFGGLIPLALGAHSRVLLPAAFGLGTGLPVIALALLISIGARGIVSAVEALARFERVARVVTGAVFIAAGGYLIATHIFSI